MTEQVQGEQKPKKRGRPARYGTAMSGALRQALSVADKRMRVEEDIAALKEMVWILAFVIKDYPEAAKTVRATPHGDLTNVQVQRVLGLCEGRYREALLAVLQDGAV